MQEPSVITKSTLQKEISRLRSQETIDTEALFFIATIVYRVMWGSIGSLQSFIFNSICALGIVYGYLYWRSSKRAGQQMLDKVKECADRIQEIADEHCRQEKT